MQSVLALVYYCIPHLEWFYLSDFVVYNLDSVPWLKIAEASLYASVWTGFFLVLAWLGFRHKNLNT
jgi:hypothetical protein